MPLSFPDFEVFWGAIFEGEAHSSAHRVEAVAARRSGVDVEHPKAFIVSYTQYMAMTADKNCGAQGANLGIHLPKVATAIEAYMRHKDAGTLPLEALPFGICKPHSVVVNVAIDRHHTLAEREQSLGALLATDVARTPHLIDLREKLPQWRVQSTVQVGYDSYTQNFELKNLERHIIYGHTRVRGFLGGHRGHIG